VSEIDAGTLSELRASGVRLVELPPSGKRPRQAIVVVDARGELRAYLNECRHLPVPLDGGTGEVLDYTGRYLLCGTHGALYELGGGLCLQGPCVGERLVPLTLRRDGERLLVDPKDPRER
jgi:nitrite reductase/ring-hydroxylating ferredoxin subunit